MLDDNDPCRRCIQAFYGEQRARRSGVRLMQHIDDGLVVLAAIGAPVVAARAYCLHPIVQETAALIAATRPGGALDDVTLPAAAVALAMDYRETANAFLSPDVDVSLDEKAGSAALSPRRRFGGVGGEPSPPDHIAGRGPRDGALPETRLMLIADKVQNHLDFVAHHQASHPRSDALTRYFRRWFEHLGVDDTERQRLEHAILAAR